MASMASDPQGQPGLSPARIHGHGSPGKPFPINTTRQPGQIPQKKLSIQGAAGGKLAIYPLLNNDLINLTHTIYA
jgi:hypothetical protein